VNIRYLLCGLLAIAFTTGLCAQQCAPPSSGLVGWWAGDGVADDISGQGNNGTAIAMSYGAGKVDQAFQMNGDTSGVVIPQSGSLAVTSLTFTAWINPSETQPQPIMEYNGENDIVGVHLWINTDGYVNVPLMLYANVRQGWALERLITAPNVILLNTWNFVGLTYDYSSGVARLYANGQMVQELNLGSYQPMTAKKFYIGNRPISNLDGGGFQGSHFDGGIDEVQVYNRALSQDEVAAIFSAGAGGVCKPSAPGSNGLVAYYPLDGNAVDASTNHLDGKIISATTATDRFGNPAGALHFNGSTDYVDLGNRPEFNFTNGFTLSAWAQLPGSTPDSYILGKYFSTGPFSNASHSYGLGIAEVSDAYGFVLGDGVFYTDLRGGTPLDDDQWHALAVTYDPAFGIKLYLDGLLIRSAFAPGLPPFANSYPLLIGQISSGYAFAGNIDDISIYGRPLSDGEVNALYREQSTRPEPPSITGQPAGIETSISQGVSLGVIATGTEPLVYQWFRNGAPIPLTTRASFNIQSATLADAGTYWVTVSNGAGSVTSAPAVLNVLATDTTNTARLLLSNHGQTNTPTFDVEGQPLSGGKFLAQAYVAGSDGTFQPVGPAVPFQAGANAGLFMPIKLSLPDRAAGQSATIQLRVWEGNAGPTFDAATANGGQHGISETIETSTGGGNIPIPAAQVNSFALVSAPFIKVQPANQKVFSGATVSLAVQAAGTEPLKYQWSFGTNIIPGATGSALVLTNVEIAQSGPYSVVISTALGSIQSVPAQLAVRVLDVAPPSVVITSPAPGIVYDETASFSGVVTDNVAVASVSYQWNNQPSAPIAMDTNGHFLVPGLTLLRGTNVFTVLALDTGGNTAVASLTLIQKALRTLSITPDLSFREGSMVRVPIQLESHGDVAGATFILNYDPTYLEAAELEWGDLPQSAFVQVNTNEPGIVRASFALSGATLATGSVHVADAVFHARSVPAAVTTRLLLTAPAVVSGTGDPFLSGTDVLSGNVHVEKRKYVGDNNGNDRLDIGDAAEMMRLVDNVEVPRLWDIPANDLNGNSQLEIGDVIRVLRAVVGLDPQPGPLATANRLLSAGGTSSGEIVLSIDKPYARAGEKVRVTIALKNFEHVLSGASLKLQYPSTALRLDDSTAYNTGALIPTKAAKVWNVSPRNNLADQDGTIAVAASTDVNWSDDNGTLASFTFTVQDAAGTEYLWPIQVSEVEFSSGFQLVAIPGNQTIFYGRAAVAPTLSGLFSSANDGHFDLTFSGEANVQYRIEASEDLKSWSGIAVLADPNGSLHVSDSSAANKSYRFYRAVQLP
jgi:hypothetical protein